MSAEAVRLLAEDEDQVIRVIARTPRPNWENETCEELDGIDRFVRERYGMTQDEAIYFFEITHTDASEFTSTLCVEGRCLGKHKILYAKSPVIANSVAALLIELEHRTGKVPHGYFKWREGNPVVNVVKFLFLGEGDVAPLTHEVLRRAIREAGRRPIVHVS